MKKFLSILGALSISVSSVATVVACNNDTATKEQPKPAPDPDPAPAPDPEPTPDPTPDPTPTPDPDPTPTPDPIDPAEQEKINQELMNLAKKRVENLAIGDYFGLDATKTYKARTNDQTKRYEELFAEDSLKNLKLSGNIGADGGILNDLLGKDFDLETLLGDSGMDIINIFLPSDGKELNGIQQIVEIINTGSELIEVFLGDGLSSVFGLFSLIGPSIDSALKGITEPISKIKNDANDWLNNNLSLEQVSPILRALKNGTDLTRLTYKAKDEDNNDIEHFLTVREMYSAMFVSLTNAIGYGINSEYQEISLTSVGINEEQALKEAASRLYNFLIDEDDEKNISSFNFNENVEKILENFILTITILNTILSIYRTPNANLEAKLISLNRDLITTYLGEFSVFDKIPTENDILNAILVQEKNKNVRIGEIKIQNITETSAQVVVNNSKLYEPTSIEVTYKIVDKVELAGSLKEINLGEILIDSTRPNQNQILSRIVEINANKGLKIDQVTVETITQTSAVIKVKTDSSIYLQAEITVNYVSIRRTRLGTVISWSNRALGEISIPTGVLPTADQILSLINVENLIKEDLEVKWITETSAVIRSKSNSRNYYSEISVTYSVTYNDEKDNSLEQQKENTNLAKTSFLTIPDPYNPNEHLFNEYITDEIFVGKKSAIEINQLGINLKGFNFGELIANIQYFLGNNQKGFTKFLYILLYSGEVPAKTGNSTKREYSPFLDFGMLLLEKQLGTSLSDIKPFVFSYLLRPFLKNEKINFSGLINNRFIWNIIKSQIKDLIDPEIIENLLLSIEDFFGNKPLDTLWSEGDLRELISKLTIIPENITKTITDSFDQMFANEKVNLENLFNKISLNKILTVSGINKNNPNIPKNWPSYYLNKSISELANELGSSFDIALDATSDQLSDYYLDFEIFESMVIELLYGNDNQESLMNQIITALENKENPLDQIFKIIGYNRQQNIIMANSFLIKLVKFLAPKAPIKADGTIQIDDLRGLYNHLTWFINGISKVLINMAKTEDINAFISNVFATTDLFEDELTTPSTVLSDDLLTMTVRVVLNPNKITFEDGSQLTGDRIVYNVTMSRTSKTDKFSFDSLEKTN